ncbi:MAG: NHLP bacteriocin system secretion protein [Lachnospiraceae bacterium]|nr:NHLP bacteriocin system secretion protein [Lachnospiraceae bacterium]
MKGVYNQDALNRIAAEDTLDRAIILVSPGVWVSILGAFIIVGVLLTWGFRGKLPYTVDTQGMYVKSDGAAAVYSQTDGFVVDIKVKEGDIIKKDDLLCTLGTEDDYYQLRQIDRRIQDVENMTFDSEADVVTSDSEQMAQIKLNARNSNKSSEQTKANLKLKEEKLEDAKTLLQVKEDLLKTYKEKYFASLSVTDNKSQLSYQEAENDYDTHFSQYQQIKNNYINTAEQYYSAKADFDAKYAKWDANAHKDEENMAYNAALEDLLNLKTQAEDFKYLMEKEEASLKEYNTALSTARKEYLEYLNEISGVASENTMASTEYSEVLQDYYNAKNSYKALLDEVDQLKLQSIFDEGNADIDGENYRQQFNNQKSSVLSSLRNQRDDILNQAAKNEIRATVEGEVYDIETAVGRAVSKGTEILDVYYGNSITDNVICYVELADARKLKKGMEVHVYPSTVNKQEYGHIKGKVTEISEYTASFNKMVERLGSDSVVNDFRKQGAVVEVKCELLKDPSSESGYLWSTKKGHEIKMEDGTLITATVVTEEKRPIDLLIPYIRDRLDFEIEEEDSGK